jgi:hypothetical protein
MGVMWEDIADENRGRRGEVVRGLKVRVRAERRETDRSMVGSKRGIIKVEGGTEYCRRAPLFLGLGSGGRC